jgi:hypothetical protein
MRRPRTPISLHALVFHFLLIFLVGLASGCGLLIGNVKPVEEKSDQYGVADLTKESPGKWNRLSAKQQGGDTANPEATATEVPDAAYQSPKTAAVISINSSCRSGETADADLKALANQLTYGISDVSRRTEQKLTLQGTEALETTVQGKMNHNDIALKTVVLRKNGCIYDLLYMAPPEHFAANEPDFDKFVASLRLK